MLASRKEPNAATVVNIVLDQVILRTAGQEEQHKAEIAPPHKIPPPIITSTEMPRSNGVSARPAIHVSTAAKATAAVPRQQTLGLDEHQQASVRARFPECGDHGDSDRWRRSARRTLRRSSNPNSGGSGRRRR